MSFQIVLIIHMLLAFGLIALILMQHGKGADAGAAFGAGASGSVFGARGANSFMYKLTASIAVGFFITSLTLAYLATPASIEKKSESVMDQVTIDPVQSDVSPTIDGKTDDVLSIDVPTIDSKTNDVLSIDVPTIDSKTNDVLSIDVPTIDSKTNDVLSTDVPTIDSKTNDTSK